jgi:hypothetical protein
MSGTNVKTLQFIFNQKFTVIKTGSSARYLEKDFLERQHFVFSNLKFNYRDFYSNPDVNRRSFLIDLELYRNAFPNQSYELRLYRGPLKETFIDGVKYINCEIYPTSLMEAYPTTIRFDEVSPQYAYRHTYVDVENFGETKYDINFILYMTRLCKIPHLSIPYMPEFPLTPHTPNLPRPPVIPVIPEPSPFSFHWWEDPFLKKKFTRIPVISSENPVNSFNKSIINPFRTSKNPVEPVLTSTPIKTASSDPVLTSTPIKTASSDYIPPPDPVEAVNDFLTRYYSRSGSDQKSVPVEAVNDFLDRYYSEYDPDEDLDLDSVMAVNDLLTRYYSDDDFAYAPDFDQEFTQDDNTVIPPVNLIDADSVLPPVDPFTFLNAAMRGDIQGLNQTPASMFFDNQIFSDFSTFGYSADSTDNLTLCLSVVIRLLIFGFIMINYKIKYYKIKYNKF